MLPIVNKNCEYLSGFLAEGDSSQVLSQITDLRGSLDSLRGTAFALYNRFINTLFGFIFPQRNRGNTLL